MLKYFAAFVLLVGISVFITRQHDKHADDTTTPPAQSSGPAVAPSDAKQAKSNAKGAIWYAPSGDLAILVFGFPNGITVWALFLTLMVIAEQTHETRKAAEATRDSVEAAKRQADLMEKTLILQYRPRIVVRHARAKTFSKEIGQGVISEPVRCVIAFQIVNIGGSPAHIVDGDIYLLSCRPSDVEEEVEIKESTHVGIGQRTLQAGERETIEVKLDTRIPNDARWIEIYEGASSHSIFLLGTVWYRDDLAIPRQTGLHRVYDPNTTVFIPREDNGEEYSD